MNEIISLSLASLLTQYPDKYEIFIPNLISEYNEMKFIDSIFGWLSIVIDVEEATLLIGLLNNIIGESYDGEKLTCEALFLFYDLISIAESHLSPFLVEVLPLLFKKSAFKAIDYIIGSSHLSSKLLCNAMFTMVDWDTTIISDDAFDSLSTFLALFFDSCKRFCRLETLCSMRHFITSPMLNIIISSLHTRNIEPLLNIVYNFFYGLPSDSSIFLDQIPKLALIFDSLEDLALLDNTKISLFNNYCQFLQLMLWVFSEFISSATSGLASRLLKLISVNRYTPLNTLQMYHQLMNSTFLVSTDYIEGSWKLTFFDRLILSLTNQTDALYLTLKAYPCEISGFYYSDEFNGRTDAYKRGTENACCNFKFFHDNTSLLGKISYSDDTKLLFGRRLDSTKRISFHRFQSPPSSFPQITQYFWTQCGTIKDIRDLNSSILFKETLFFWNNTSLAYSSLFDIFAYPSDVRLIKSSIFSKPVSFRCNPSLCIDENTGNFFILGGFKDFDEKEWIPEVLKITSSCSVLCDKCPFQPYSLATFLHGSLFVFGSNSFWKFDFSTFEWERLPLVPPPRRNYSFGRLDDSKLYLFGGCDMQSNHFRDLWLFDVNCRVWSNIWNGNAGPTYTVGSCTIFNHDLFVLCDNSLWSFNLKNNQWSSCPSFGGFPPNELGGKLLSITDIRNIKTDSWLLSKKLHDLVHDNNSISPRFLFLNKQTISVASSIEYPSETEIVQVLSFNGTGFLDLTNSSTNDVFSSKIASYTIQLDVLPTTHSAIFQTIISRGNEFVLGMSPPKVYFHLNGCKKTLEGDLFTGKFNHISVTVKNQYAFLFINGQSHDREAILNIHHRAAKFLIGAASNNGNDTNFRGVICNLQIKHEGDLIGNWPLLKKFNNYCGFFDIERNNHAIPSERGLEWITVKKSSLPVSDFEEPMTYASESDALLWEFCGDANLYSVSESRIDRRNLFAHLQQHKPKTRLLKICSSSPSSSVYDYMDTSAIWCHSAFRYTRGFQGFLTFTFEVPRYNNFQSTGLAVILRYFSSLYGHRLGDKFGWHGLKNSLVIGIKSISGELSLYIAHSYPDTNTEKVLDSKPISVSSGKLSFDFDGTKLSATFGGVTVRSDFDLVRYFFDSLHCFVGIVASAFFDVYIEQFSLEYIDRSTSILSNFSNRTNEECSNALEMYNDNFQSALDYLLDSENSSNSPHSVSSHRDTNLWDTNLLGCAELSITPYNTLCIVKGVLGQSGSFHGLMFPSSEPLKIYGRWKQRAYASEGHTEWKPIDLELKNDELSGVWHNGDATGHTSGFRTKSWLFTSPSLGYRGIVNSGNSCYLSAFIQCLFATSLFRNQLSSICLPNSSRGTLQQLCSLFLSLRFSLDVETTAYHFQKSLPEPWCQPGQQDSSEFGSWLLDFLQSFTKKLDSEKIPEVSTLGRLCELLPSWDDEKIIKNTELLLSGKVSPIPDYLPTICNKDFSNLFQGEMVNAIFCENCHSFSYNQEEYNNLSIGLPREYGPITGLIVISGDMPIPSGFTKIHNEANTNFHAWLCISRDTKRPVICDVCIVTLDPIHINHLISSPTDVSHLIARVHERLDQEYTVLEFDFNFDIGPPTLIAYKSDANGWNPVTDIYLSNTDSDAPAGYIKLQLNPSNVSTPLLDRQPSILSPTHSIARISSESIGKAVYLFFTHADCPIVEIEVRHGQAPPGWFAEEIGGYQEQVHLLHRRNNNKPPITSLSLISEGCSSKLLLPNGMYLSFSFANGCPLTRLEVFSAKKPPPSYAGYDKIDIISQPTPPPSPMLHSPASVTWLTNIGRIIIDVEKDEEYFAILKGSFDYSSFEGLFSLDEGKWTFYGTMQTRTSNSSSIIAFNFESAMNFSGSYLSNNRMDVGFGGIRFETGFDSGYIDYTHTQKSTPCIVKVNNLYLCIDEIDTCSLKLESSFSPSRSVFIKEESNSAFFYLRSIFGLYVICSDIFGNLSLHIEDKCIFKFGPEYQGLYIDMHSNYTETLQCYRHKANLFKIDSVAYSPSSFKLEEYPISKLDILPPKSDIESFIQVLNTISGSWEMDSGPLDLQVARVFKGHKVSARINGDNAFGFAYRDSLSSRLSYDLFLPSETGLLNAKVLKLYSPDEGPSHLRGNVFSELLSTLITGRKDNFLSLGLWWNNSIIWRDGSCLSSSLVSDQNLNTMLHAHLAPQVLSGSNMYRCEHCASKQKALRYYQFSKHPSHLLISLKRFAFDPISQQKTKLFTKCSVPVFLELPEKAKQLNKLLPVESKEQSSLYGLYGAIIHSGLSPDLGHYYSFARESEGGDLTKEETDVAPWFKFDDTKVTPSSFSTLSSLPEHDSVYILFYRMMERGTTRHPPFQYLQRPSPLIDSIFHENEIRYSRLKPPKISSNFLPKMSPLPNILHSSDIDCPLCGNVIEDITTLCTHYFKKCPVLNHHCGHCSRIHSQEESCSYANLAITRCEKCCSTCLLSEYERHCCITDLLLDTEEKEDATIPIVEMVCPSCQKNFEEEQEFFDHIQMCLA